MTQSIQLHTIRYIPHKLGYLNSIFNVPSLFDSINPLFDTMASFEKKL